VNPKQIMIVEDQELAAANLRYMLQAHGHKVIASVPSGEEAIQKAAELNTELDLVLMDIHLAGEMTGIDATKEILANHQLPVVYLTAEANLKGSYQTDITEAYGYLLKPFSAGELRAMVSTALHRHQVELELQRAKQRQQLAYELGQQLTALLDATALLSETVNHLRQTFGYYHVHVYLLHMPEHDASTASWTLVVQEATGHAGAMMLEVKHKIFFNAERSLVAQAARSRKPVAVNDVTKAPTHLPNQLLPDTQSEVAMPLVVGERLIGVLDVQDTRLNHFNDDEIRTLEIIANQLAVALSNAQLFADNVRKAERLETLRDIDQAILSAQSPAEIAKAALNHVEKLLLGLQINVVEFDYNNHDVIILAQQGQFNLSIESRISLNDMDSSIESLKQETVVKFERNPPWLQDAKILQTLEDNNVEGFYCVSLMTADGLIGCLNIGVANLAEFSQEDIDIAKEVAAILAVAIQQARQREAIQEAENRYHSLFENNPIGLYRSTPKGQILDANPAMVEMLGYPDRDSLLGVNAFHTYVSIEEREDWQDTINREGVVRDFEVRLRRRDGTIIWVRNSATAIQDVKGKVLYYEGALVS